MKTTSQFSSSFKPEGLGERLRQARLAAGIDQARLAERMHVLIRIVDDIENDRFERLGAEIYIRGHLRSYAREVGLDRLEIEAIVPVSTTAPSTLVCMAPTSRWQARLDAVTHRSVHIALTAAIVVPLIWLATNRQLPAAPEHLAVLPPIAETTSGTAAKSGSPVETAAAPQLASASLTPRLFGSSSEQAGLAGNSGNDQVPTGPVGQWTFIFAAESWFELVDPDGRRLVHELVPAGAKLRFEPDQVGRVTLGNAEVVKVELAGEAIDLSPYRRANVVRFAVSSQGKPAPLSSDG